VARRKAGIWLAFRTHYQAPEHLKRT
jgi:hypothetical protein